MFFRRQMRDRITAGEGRIFGRTISIDKSAFSQTRPKPSAHEQSTERHRQLIIAARLLKLSSS